MPALGTILSTEIVSNYRLRTEVFGAGTGGKVCCHFVQSKISLKNQSTSHAYVQLRTFLSTESVQNSTCRNLGNTLHCAIPLSCCFLPIQEFHLLAILQAAGWPIWLLLIASIIALALIIERLIYLRREKILPRQLLDEVIQVYRGGKVTPDIIDKLQTNSPLGAVLASALKNVDAPRDVMKESIEEAGRGVAHQLERFLTTLGTIASLAPLMGLFGTVVGMIEIFGAQNASGTNPAQLAHGISVALYNTGFGLAIAMPALVAYRHFRALVDSFIIDMELQAVKFVDVVHGARK